MIIDLIVICIDTSFDSFRQVQGWKIGPKKSRFFRF